jgi:glycosyltransferase involved in cell wall biosynthesis
LTASGRRQGTLSGGPLDAGKVNEGAELLEISVVIPVYGCEGCLPALHERLRAALSKVSDEVEIIFVDDRSKDDGWGVLAELARNDPQVIALRLSRNFGQHAAITAGLAESSGRWVVVMDCDLQDPPEYVPRLYAKAKEGYDVVFSRRQRRRQSLFRRVSGQLYFRVRNALVNSDMDPNMTNLSIVSRKVVDAFLTVNDRNRQYLLIVDWLGFNQTTIDVAQDQRAEGRSTYTLGALVRVAIDGLFFDSTVLLRWIVYTGFGIAFVGGMLALAVLYFRLTSDPLPGWTSVSMIVLLMSGFITLTLGVAGLYIGKIFDQVKGRPLYVVDTKVLDGVERGVRRELREPAGADVDREREPLSG